MTELINVIQETDDYKKFQKMRGNRFVREPHVKELMQSFEQYPSLRRARPVVLNEKDEIVDGQHSLEASIRLNLGIFYMVVPGLTIKETRVINALQRPWTMMDFAESFAGDNNHDGYLKYRIFIDLRGESGLPPSTLLTYMTDTHHGGTVRRKFRLGIFEPIAKEKYMDKLEKLSDFSENLIGWNDQAFALAVHKIILMDKYDHERMMKNLGKTQIMHRSSRTEYLRDLEAIYNKNATIGHHLRFL